MRDVHGASKGHNRARVDRLDSRLSYQTRLKARSLRTPEMVGHLKDIRRCDEHDDVDFRDENELKRFVRPVKMAVAERRLRAPFARQRASTSPYPIPIRSYPPIMYPSRRLSRSNACRVRHERRCSAVICGANIHFPRYPSAGRLHRSRDRLAVGLRHLGAR